MQKEERLVGYDNVKYFLIVSVVMGHTINYFVEQSNTMREIWLFIYTFHMPLFLFLSGLFQKQYTQGRQLKVERIISLCMIGFLIKILNTIVEVMLGESPSFKLLTGDGTHWFVFTLAAFMLITYVMRNMKPVVLMIVALLLGCFVGYDQTIGDYLCLSRIVVFFPFYLAGYYLNPDSVMQFVQKKKIKILSLIVLGGILYACIVHVGLLYGARPLLTGRNAFSETVIANGGWLLRLAYYGVVTLSSLSVLSLIPKSKIPLVSWGGKYTMQIFFWHKSILIILMSVGVGDFLFAQGFIGKVAILCLPLIISYLLSFKCFSFPTEYIMRYAFVERKKE